MNEASGVALNTTYEGHPRAIINIVSERGIAQ